MYYIYHIYEWLMSVYMRVVPFADSYLYLCYFVGKVDERKELNCIVHGCWIVAKVEIFIICFIKEVLYKRE